MQALKHIYSITICQVPSYGIEMRVIVVFEQLAIEALPVSGYLNAVHYTHAMVSGVQSAH